jgi:hypothetical protein
MEALLLFPLEEPMIDMIEKMFTIALVPVIVLLCCAPSPLQGEVVARYGDGFLEDNDGYRVLHVKGSQYEMGYQYGKLMAEELCQVVPMVNDYFASFGVPEWLVEIAKRIVSTTYVWFYPPEDIEYLSGIYFGVGEPFIVTFSDLVALNALIDVGGLVGEIFDDITVMNCSSFAAWGSLTEEGKTFQTRNVDLVTGTGLENFVLMTYHKPEGNIPYANIGWCGFIGCASGLSARGIGIGQIWGYTMDHNIGTPWPFKTRRILMESTSAEEAAWVMNDLPFRTYGSNFVFGDGFYGDGRAVETTWHHCAIFRDNDPKEDEALFEDECYAIKIEDAVFRADCAMDPVIRSVQTAANGPDGDPREASSYKLRYKGQADEIQYYRDNTIPIGKEEAQAISQKVAMRGSSLQCVVYGNTDQEFWCANSVIVGNVPHDACDQEYVYYDFYRYLPSVDIETDQYCYGPFDRMTVTLVTNSSARRDLYEDIYIYLDYRGTHFYLPGLDPIRKPYDVNRLFPAGETGEEIVYDEDVSWEIPRGTMHWRVEAFDSESGKLIDLGSREIRVRWLLNRRDATGEGEQR